MNRFLKSDCALAAKLSGLFMMLFLSLLSLDCPAQTCNGVLGSPVLNIDFGSGKDRGSALPITESDYIYTSTNAILNSQYTIANNSNGFYSQWFSITDHTGNENGYMMLINCNLPGDQLFIKPISGLCPNTTYQLSSWILNLLNKDLLKGIDVNLTFSVETSSGTVLNSLKTGDVVSGNVPEWRNFNLYFTTPVQQTDLVIKIINNAPGGDGNDLALDDITVRPCQPMVNTSFIGQNLVRSLSLCQGDAADYQLGSNIVADYQNPAYQWQVNKDGTGWKDIAGETATTTKIHFTAAQPGFYQYRLYTIQEANKNLMCCQVFSDTLTIWVDAKPVPSASGNTPLCMGNTLNLTVAKGASYQWTGPAGFTSSIQNPTITNITSAQVGMYKVTLTSAAGCVATDSVKVELNPATSFSAGADTTICKGSSTVLNASGGNAYLWYPAKGLSDTTIANPVASPMVSTVYRVKITNQFGCINLGSVKVNVVEIPVADAGPDKKVAAGKKVRLSGKIRGGNAKFYWSPTTFLSDTNTLEPLVTPAANITYTLHAVSGLGCGETIDSVNVQVYQELNVPNTFSPNADGINDTWNILALQDYPSSIVQVYNRYGKEIFRTISNNNPWNGTLNGQPLPIGTYFYKISNDNKPLKSGWVLIVR